MQELQEACLQQAFLQNGQDNRVKQPCPLANMSNCWLKKKKEENAFAFQESSKTQYFH